jgi:hypothetical protein
MCAEAKASKCLLSTRRVSVLVYTRLLCVFTVHVTRKCFFVHVTRKCLCTKRFVQVFCPMDFSVALFHNACSVVTFPQWCASRPVHVCHPYTSNRTEPGGGLPRMFDRCTDVLSVVSTTWLVHRALQPKLWRRGPAISPPRGRKNRTGQTPV